MAEGRYYVQCITNQVFVIRERMSPDGVPGPNDRFVRAFDMRHDAYMYVQNMNATPNAESSADVASSEHDAPSE